MGPVAGGGGLYWAGRDILSTAMSYSSTVSTPSLSAVSKSKYAGIGIGSLVGIDQAIAIDIGFFKDQGHCGNNRTHD